ncbi:MULTISPECIES: XdhC family protein [unclassified Kitasatospora]|uniref:XdhC family protein n=1 Tax=unclassified Kitasatospora TaxID=2633591 RepID=UPI00070F101D|nr:MULTISPECIES: XdhC family protein [unclassified Kitasatospora]KQV04664.1 xanthine dehydrogenase [Kitasatospora sp. Root107]KRB60810.1 xanthine dehydrogenase [Kitasatospora sp. Root187]
MQDIAEQLLAWHSSGRSFAVATVVGVSGSAPRDPGAALAVDADGEAIGSVSGGCVEGAVYELCQEAIASGTPVLERFGYSDEDAFAVGLTCGGILDVFVQPVVPGADPALDAGITYIASGTPVALARIVAGPAGLLGATVAVTADTHHGSLTPAPSTTILLERAAVAEARAMLDAGRTGQLVLGLDGRPCDDSDQGTVTFFIESYVPAPRMIVFGAIDFAAAVVRIGKFLGYRVTVCDARPVFATARRFPEADEVVVDWPHRYLDSQLALLDGRTVLCVLTHDAKFDIPLLERALRLPVAFVGAMGSRKTHRDRNARLREVGLTDAEIGRLRSPIGLDLGARTPEETAVSVAAEIVAHRRGGSCLPLSAGEGPIHHDLARAAEAVPSAAA